MITLENAYNLRFERELRLPPNAEYETERLAQIAKRQSELTNEMAELDNELLGLVAEAAEIGLDDIKALLER